MTLGHQSNTSDVSPTFILDANRESETGLDNKGKNLLAN